MKTPSARLPRSKRLRTSAEFGSVFSDATRSADRYFTVLARPGKLPEARLGLAVSKRAAKRAVDRNRLKRLARESFRRRSDLRGCDVVVIARPGAAAATNAELTASLGRHFDRLRAKLG